jgi:hypothetical protein
VKILGNPTVGERRSFEEGGSEADHRRGEIRLEEGTNQSRERARRLDHERGPCETDDVTRADSGGSAAQPATRGGQRAVTE